MNKNKVALILGVVCVVLTYAICVQLKTIEIANKTVSSSYTENQLRDEVLKWKENYDRKYAQLQEAEKILETTRKRATENDAGSASVEEKLKAASKFLGYTSLTGKGITITLDDNKTQSVDGVTTGNISDYIVHDDDLIVLVNDLKNAGAEAISINNQRIVTTTGIVCDGNVIRINQEKVSAPYVITAIGSPEGLMGGIYTLGAYIEELEIVGVVKEVKKSNSLVVPKYEGVISFEYMKNF